MRFTTDLGSASWTVPVPVKRSRFAAMDPSHDAHNVETDLAAIGAFELDPSRPLPDVVHSDLQTLPMWNAAGRLGSGRAGVHGDAYLKGIGRTTLAANWADPEDRYHGTGHMLPTAAGREWLVSQALSALGLGDTIVPCTGLLAAELPRPGDAMLAAMLPDVVGRFARADRRLQAISVKPADFARLSNFVFAFDRLGGPAELGPLLHRMHHFLAAPGARPERPGDTTPEAVAAAFARSIERGVAHFGRWAEAGVFWGSLSNNVSADGRFLDLEVPIFVGRPVLGVVGDPEGGFRSAHWFGVELFSWLRETRAFVTVLRERLRLLAAHVFPRGVTHEFLGAVVEALEAELGPEHILWARAPLVEAAARPLVVALDLDAERAARVRTIVEHLAAVALDDVPADLGAVTLRRVDLTLAPPEPGRRRALAVPDFLHDAIVRDLEAARVYQESLAWMDDAGSVEDFLARAREAGERVRAAVRR